MKLLINLSILREKIFRRHGFVRNVATMLAGNMSAQLISFLAAPVITRLYAPEDFGGMALLAAYIGIFSVIVAFRYEKAIVLAATIKESLNAFALTLFVACAVFWFLFLVVVGYGQNIAFMSKNPRIEDLLWLLPFAVFVNGFRQSFILFFTKDKKFGLLSNAQILVSVTTASVKIMAGLMIGSSAFWLIMGNILGPLAALIMLAFIFFRKYFSKFQKSVSIDQILLVAKKFKEFPKYGVLAGLLNSVSQNFPVLLLGYYFPKEIVGFYGLAISILRRPIGLMSHSLNNVFLQTVAEKEAQGLNLQDTLRKTTLGLAAIGAIPLGVLALAGDPLFSLFFGDGWKTAGVYAQLLAPWLFFLFINPPATQIIQVKQRLSFQLYFNIASIMCRSGAIVAGAIFYDDPIVAIGLFSAVGVLLNIYYIMYSFSFTKEKNV